MRERNGALITAWVPGNHGAGGSTIANAVGITLQHFSGKKTLIVNYGSPKSYMERYMENEVDMRFSMDYLRSFGESITAQHIKTYATPINEMLYIIPNCKLSREITKVGERFNQRFLDEALSAFEVVVIDIEAGMNPEKQWFLEKSDVILAVMTMNEIMLDELYQSNCDNMIRRFLQDEKTMRVFNMIHSQQDIEKELKQINRKYGMQSSFGISLDSQTYMACCTERKFYSFMKKQLAAKKGESKFSEQIRELSNRIAEQLFISVDVQADNHRFLETLLTKARQWGEADA